MLLNAPDASDVSDVLDALWPFSSTTSPCPSLVGTVCEGNGFRASFQDLTPLQLGQCQLWNLLSQHSMQWLLGWADCPLKFIQLSRSQWEPDRT